MNAAMACRVTMLVERKVPSANPVVSPWSEAAEPRESVGEIIDRLLAPETPPTPDPAANNSSYVNIGNGVFDRLTEHATWSDILEPAGHK